MSIRFELPQAGRLRANNEKDPLPYYYKRGVGRLYRRRLQMGLDLVDGGGHVLEVGVGSGILVPTLTKHFPEYTGTDLVLAPGLDALVEPSCNARFKVIDLLDSQALPKDGFDAVVCFSVLEHIHNVEAAARSLARVLAPGGRLVVGYPMVAPLMARAFGALGYKNIEADHVTTPIQIAGALTKVLRPVHRAALPRTAPVSLALYQCTSWTKR
jgi:2-polyprenyl-3-methyl-5-hydroxy-6-metoxy-1,4-benzoquinol methylase